jgi:hypothetical protein
MVECPKNETAIIAEAKSNQKSTRKVTFSFTAQDCGSTCWIHEVHQIKMPGLKWGKSDYTMVWYEYKLEADVTDEVD